MSSYRWLVLQEILRQLTDEVDFQPEPGDTCKAISRSSIVFRKNTRRWTGTQQNFEMMSVFPGIVISTPYVEPFNMSAGESAHDEYVYRYLAQIVDSDNLEPTKNVPSYWKWQEQVVRLFQFNSLCRVNAPTVLSTSRSVDVVDESVWVRAEHFVCGIEIDVQVWMTRGAT